jgi:hypothetical protein
VNAESFRELISALEWGADDYEFHDNETGEIVFKTSESDITDVDMIDGERVRLVFKIVRKMTNLDTLLPEIANTRIKSAFYKFPKRMVFVGDFAEEALTRKEAVEKEIEWLKATPCNPVLL